MRTTFSSEEIAKLKENPCIHNCSERYISYTLEFKVRALDLYAQGVSPKEIWRRADFDTSKWKSGYFGWTLKDWRKIVEKKGIDGLTNFGGIQSDRGPKSENEKLRRLELQVRYLEAENDFLAKLRAKRAESNSGHVKNMRSSEN